MFCPLSHLVSWTTRCNDLHQSYFRTVHVKSVVRVKWLFCNQLKFIVVKVKVGRKNDSYVSKALLLSLNVRNKFNPIKNIWLHFSIPLIRNYDATALGCGAWVPSPHITYIFTGPTDFCRRLGFCAWLCKLLCVFSAPRYRNK